ncbi:MULTISPECIES: FlgO family outer membrane protein [Hydrogenophaga]|uniref:FlgO family outer membrane protein n=2 Tax=Hydrogenophaga TaxID=47420 RepID=A0ABW2QJJ4_9BURK
MTGPRRALLRRLFLSACVPLAGALAACTTPVSGDALIQLNYQAADALLQGTRLDPRQPVLMATLVDLDDLERSSRWGRLASEHLAARLANRGVLVKELKLRQHIFMAQDSGALLLSREVKDLSLEHDAQAVVVGTYTVGGDTVYVSLKLIRPEGNTVMSAHDYSFPLSERNRALMR